MRRLEEQGWVPFLFHHHYYYYYYISLIKLFLSQPMRFLPWEKSHIFCPTPSRPKGAQISPSYKRGLVDV